MMSPAQAAADLQLRIVRAMTGAQRLALAIDMSTTARDLALAGLKARHPDWEPDRCRRELLRSARQAERSTGGAP